MYSEDEARRLWCPFVRRAVVIQGVTGAERVGGATANRNDVDEPYGHCVASKCMAWRWTLATTYREEATPKGFCGLAGG